MSSLSTPVLFLIFNRPDTTLRVFEQIRLAKPQKLFIAADGARADKAGELELCTKLRATLLQSIDWDCEVQTLFREHNLGCRNAVSGAITWFFEQVEEGIILEDDCLPHPDFFGFCTQMLEKYRHDTRVMHVSGCNLGTKSPEDTSYYFSRHANIWGWATWRRAWQYYDADLRSLPAFLEGKYIKNIIHNTILAKRYLFVLKRMYSKGVQASTWDYQWTYTLFVQNGLAVTPNVNLISNIGFGQMATHATQQASGLALLPTEAILPLQHPNFVAPAHEADTQYLYKVIAPIWKRALYKIKQKLN